MRILAPSLQLSSWLYSRSSHILEVRAKALRSDLPLAAQPDDLGKCLSPFGVS